MLGEAPSFLEDFVDAVLRREEFNLLLQNQKDHSGVDHDGKPLLIIPLHIFPSVLFFIAFDRKVICIYNLELEISVGLLLQD